MPPSVVISSSVISTNLTITPNITFGAPRANVTWLKDGQVLEVSDRRVNISNEGALTVTGIDASDGGIYTVMVTNIYGAANASVQVQSGWCFFSIIKVGITGRGGGGNFPQNEMSPHACNQSFPTSLISWRR
jgi:hypothetical protein